MASQLLRRVAGEDPNLGLKFPTYHLSYQAQHLREARGAFEALARPDLYVKKMDALF